MTSLPAPPLQGSSVGSRSCQLRRGLGEGVAGLAVPGSRELEEVKLRTGLLPCLKRVSKARPETLAARALCGACRLI